MDIDDIYYDCGESILANNNQDIKDDNNDEDINKK